MSGRVKVIVSGLLMIAMRVSTYGFFDGCFPIQSTIFCVIYRTLRGDHLRLLVSQVYDRDRFTGQLG